MLGEVSNVRQAAVFDGYMSAKRLGRLQSDDYYHVCKQRESEMPNALAEHS